MKHRLKISQDVQEATLSVHAAALCKIASSKREKKKKYVT